MKGFVFLGLCVSPFYFAQNSVQDTIKTKEIEAVSFTKRLPVSKEIISVEKDLANKNLAQDLPILLKNQMSVVSTSDAGNGVGYSGFRIRGVAGNSINVMMNGVPYNDSESQGTFFVNVPDLTSSASSIIIQRGVGTSSNGVSAFGASVNILTKSPEEKPYFSTQQSHGSFDTRKHSFEAGTGKFLSNKLSLMGRYSIIKSDGYIDRAFSDLNSYNITALFESGNTKLRALAFGGKEKTYQAWNGISKEDYAINPKLNLISGAIYNSNGTISFYDNETDNYRQNHYHLLWEQQLSDKWKTETTFHYTKGKGYYENYKQDQKLAKYNLTHITENGLPISKTDLIRKKWLDNDFYGFVANVYGNLENLDINWGVVANQYKGLHFGEVTAVKSTTNIPNEYRYYENLSTKNELSMFSKAIWKIQNFELFGDIQFRSIGYTAEIIQEGNGEGGNIDKNWLFFNPKTGISYKIPSGKVFFSYAHAHREPNRDDLLANSKTNPEKLHDFELGLEKQINQVSFTVNAYFMNYENQLVLTGKLNNVGSPIRENSGKSYRLGVEMGVAAKISEMLSLSGNLTLSQNKNRDYHIEIDDVDTHGNPIKTTKNLGNTAISFSPDLIANAKLTFSPFKNLNFTIQNQYIHRQYMDNTQNEALKIPGYNILDFIAHYDFKIQKQELGIHFNLNNALNRKYYNNGYVYSAAPYYYPQAGINYMLGMSWKITGQTR